VLFTDEATFTRDGIQNFHNQHVWTDENPHATVQSHHQQRFCINIWTGIVGDCLLGPQVLPNRLTGQNYKAFLQNNLADFLDVPLTFRRKLHFMHDGAPAHFSLLVRQHLDEMFPGKWVGRSGPIAWPPRSPDLNPLDFFLWSYAKFLVYSSAVDNVETLRNRIVTTFQTIRATPGIWERVRGSMRRRAEAYIVTGGGHIEHFL